MSDVIELLEKLPVEKRQAVEKQIKANPEKFNLFPLSSAQERLWFLDQMYPNSSMYNIATAVKIRGKLDRGLLERSLNKLIERHEILRTRFLTIDGVPFQAIKNHFSMSIPVVELHKNNGNTEAVELKNLIHQVANQPFKLSELPLMRAQLIKLAPDEHIFVLAMHHIITDGWSFGVVIAELIEIYRALKENRSPNLPELPIQYVDYASWENKFRQSEEYKKQLKFWVEKLADQPPILELPTDFPRKPKENKRGRHHHFEIPQSVVQKIKQVSKTENVTPFMILLGAFNILLARLARQNDICVGVPVANRDKNETRFLIGFLVNTVVLRNQVNWETTFKDFLQQIKYNTVASFANQAVAFEDIVEEIQPERSTLHPPIFQVLFTYQNMPKKQVVDTALTFERVDVETDAVKFDLTLTIDETPDKLVASFGYDVDLFQPQTIKLWEKYFIHLLDFGLNHLTSPLHNIPLTDPDELEQFYQETININRRALPEPALLHQLFEQSARKFAQKTAVLEIPPTLDDDEAIAYSYRQLNQAANKIAHFLLKQKVKREEIIGLYVTKNFKMVSGMLGILKAGGAYLPLEPSYPDSRLYGMLKETNARLVLTEKSLQGKLADYDGQLVFIEDILADHTIADSNPDVPVRAENLAYIIFTSGSTGKPKGVLVPHRAVVNYVSAVPEIFQLTERDRVLQFASMSFDAAAEEIYPTLFTGAMLVLRPESMISSARVFIEMSEKWQLSVWDLPTAYWHQLVNQALEESLSIPSTLKLVIIGGERAKPEMLEKWWQITEGKRIRLLNTYGPTETAIVATYWETQREGTLKEVPIGKPVPNVKIRVTDAYGTLLPPTVPGELLIGGQNVTRGYLQDSALTASKFVPDENGGRLYCTGDVVRILSSGNLEFIGRLDNQVKVRGYRIELGEIEKVVKEDDRIKDALVTTFEDDFGQQNLVCYYIPGGEISDGELRRYLQRKLPHYMVPAKFIPIEEFPLTVAGKVDIRALPKPEQTAQESEGFVPPETYLEKLLAELWAEVLQVERVGVHDNFFEMGGDSLKAAILINKIQKELKEVLYVVALFDAQNIRELATYLEREFPEGVSRWIKRKFPDAQITLHKAVPEVTGRNISAENLKKFQVLVEKRYPTDNEDQFLSRIHQKNPPMVFILSAPRSGSTLLRVMLAGNPSLFSPPELALLNFQTLQQRKSIYADRNAGWLEGLYRAIMEIHHCNFEQAKTILAKYEADNFTTYQFYGVLQEWIGERMLVDKTTTYALSETILKRAEHFFENAYYIHLVRHPNAMIQSYINSHLDPVFGYDLPFHVREKAEMFWITSNQNIVRFLQEIPENRKYFLKYEDLVTQPEAIMQSIASFLNIDYDPEMINPYHGNKMTDGVHPESKMVGDPLFHTHKTIDPGLAKKWRTLPEGDELSDFAQMLAKKLGYATEKKKTFAVITPRKEKPERIPLSFAQQRLWFLHQLNPNLTAYHMPFVYKIEGNLDVEALKKATALMIKRHEILRTHFEVEDGKPYQKVNSTITVPLEMVSLSKKQDNLNLDEVIRNLVQQPFDLSRPPLFRLHLIPTGEKQWILVLVMHHIISDGWSMGLFVQEMIRYYKGYTEKQAVQIHPLPIQYSDYAIWQREWMESEDFVKQLDFWKEYLSGMPPLLNLPTDNPRPKTQTYNGDIIELEIPDDIARSFKALLQKQGITLFNGLLGLFSILLHKYSGQEDFGIGIPVANRTRAELEELIGFLVNTLVVRCQVDDQVSLIEWLKSMNANVARTLAHQEVPFEKIVDALDVPRDTSYSPLFQVMFSLNNIPRKRQTVSNIAVQPLLKHSGSAKFDLSLEIVERPDGSLAGLFEYNVDLFEKDTVLRIKQHFQNLMREVVAHPEVPIAKVRLMDKTEERLVTTQWNKTQKSLTPPFTFPQQFEAQVQRTPNELAVVFQDNQITYQELNQWANQLAHFLVAHGVQSDQLVGIAFDRSIEMVVAIVAVLKSGAAYVPLDLNYPEERLHYILQDAGVQVLLTGGNPELFKHFKGTVLNITDRSQYQSYPTDNLSTYPEPENLAYVIYTSGSTGKPKGVMISHRSVIHLKEALFNKIYASFQGEHFNASLNAPVLFDASVQQLVLLLMGHTLHIVPQEARTDGEALLQFIRTHRIDVLDCVPTQLKLMFEVGFCEGQSHTPRICLPGGEAIDPALWQRLKQCKTVQFFNMYGPTECTVDSIVANITEADDKPVIGKPLDNMQVYILDAGLNPVPVGVVGEIYLAGEGVARGYLNNPELTAERFLPNPFSATPGARMYRTGDLGRYRNNGDIEFIGRADDQIKLHGYRIELGEIEAVIKQHPLVKDCVARIYTEDSHHSRIVAYWVPKSGAQHLSNKELKEFAALQLPQYMVPAIFMELTELPLTPNGKVDKKRLPKPTIDLEELKAKYAPPTNPIEEKLVTIWQEVLKVPQVGIRDNFFELGGDSILSIQVVSRANQMGIKISPLQIFQNQTIEQLAAVVEEATPIKAEQGMITGEVPLTPIQLWFFEQKFKKKHYWNQSVLLKISRHLDPEYLKETVRYLMLHHDMLRARFYRKSSGVLQQNIVSPNEYIPFHFVDLSDKDPETFARFVTKETRKVKQHLNLKNGPLFQVVYFYGGDGPGDRLFVTVHHLAIDGISWRVLLEDFFGVYEQLARGLTPQLPPKTTSFKEWATRIREFARSDAVKAELDYWENLPVQSAASLPIDNPQGMNTEGLVARVQIAFTEEETTQLLQEAPDALKANINEILLSGLAGALRQWTNGSIFHLNMEGHGREQLFDDIDVSRTLGWFTSMYPVILDVSDSYSITDIVKRVKNQFRAIPQNGIGFGLLRYLGGTTIRKKLAMLDQAPISFNYLGRFDRGLPPNIPIEGAPESTGPDRDPENHRATLIDITGGVRDGKLEFTIGYSRDMFTRETIQRLADAFKNAIKEIIAIAREPEKNVLTSSDFPLAGLDDDKLNNLLSKLKK